MSFNKRHAKTGDKTSTSIVQTVFDDLPVT